MLRSQKGSGILVYLLMISIFGAFFFASVQSYMMGLERAKASYKNISEKKMLLNELKIVFANEAICANFLKITGSDFIIGNGVTNILAPNMDYEKVLRLRQLKVENVSVTSASNNKLKADFVIYFRTQGQNADEHLQVTVGYRVDSFGAISACHLYIDPVVACSDASGTWDPVAKICNFCFRAGGQWVPGSPGYCVVVRGQ